MQIVPPSFLLVGTGRADDLVLAEPAGGTILARGGDDTLRAGPGDASLAGANGDDLLMGGAGADSLRGGAGADTLSGGAGDDRLFGGAGADLFLFGPAGGRDRAAVDGADHVVIDAGAGSIRVAVAPAGIMRFLLLDAAGDLVGTVLLFGSPAMLELRAEGDVTVDPRARLAAGAIQFAVEREEPRDTNAVDAAPGGGLVLPGLGDLSPFG